MEEREYKSEVDTLLSYFKIDAHSLTDINGLAILLGCPYIGSHSDLFLQTPEQPAEDCETVAHEAIMAMLYSFRSERTLAAQEDKLILSGLTRNDRWMACLASEDAAYAFSATMVHFLWRLQTSWGMSYAEQLHRDTVRSAVQTVLSQWLGPAETDSGYSSRGMASKLFGEPWCMFVLDSLRDTDSRTSIILASRPAFAAGLLTCDVKVALEDHLPEMMA
jgi:hypothetical protein